ncbi:MAG: type II secretion system minor pseudopilin GspI [Chromatiales bacterium]|jgi:general secretion pathway protein I
MKSFNTQRAFTLLEVLVAMTILALCMIALIQTVSQAASSESHLEDKVLAQWVALNQITGLQLQENAYTAGTLQGSEIMAGREWYWQANISGTSNAGLLRVVMQVGRVGQDHFLHSVTAYLGQSQ